MARAASIACLQLGRAVAAQVHQALLAEQHLERLQRRLAGVELVDDERVLERDVVDDARGLHDELGADAHGVELLLQQLGQRVAVGGDGQLDVDAVGVAGLGEQLLGLRGVVGVEVVELVVVRHVALGERLPQRLAVAEVGDVDERLAVDGVADGLAHERVVERLDGVVDVEHAHRQHLERQHREAGALDGVDLRGGQADDVELPGLQPGRGDGGVRRRLEHEPVQEDVIGVPERRVLRQVGVGVRHVLVEHELPGPDRFGGEGGRVGGDRRRADDHAGLARQQQRDLVVGLVEDEPDVRRAVDDDVL